MTDPTPLNAAELAEVRARCDAATPVSKVVYQQNTADARQEVFVRFRPGYSSGLLRAADAEFFGRARTDIPRLLKTIEAREQQLGRVTGWRCFHCGFETLDEKEAGAHFGDRDDPEEFKPICRWWHGMKPEERGDALQDVIQQLNDERDRAERAEAQRDGLLAALRFIHEHISDPERGFRDLYPAFGLDARRAVEMAAAAIDAAGDHACHPATGKQP